MRIAIGVLFICSLTLAFGQKDRIYLKNGSVLIGKSMDSVKSETLTLQVDTTKFQIPFSLVEEVRFKDKEHIKVYNELQYAKGWATAIDMGMFVGSESVNAEPQVNPVIGITQYYQHAPWLNLGLGVKGYNHQSYWIMPLLIDYQALLGKSKSGFLVYASAGKAFMSEEKRKSDRFERDPGPYYRVGVGYQIRKFNSTLQIRAGYVVQELQERFEQYTGYYRINDLQIRRIEIQAVIMIGY